jgi:hypothetical protein
MKADVLPAVTVEPLRIPSWVPQSVAHVVRQKASEEAVTPLLISLVQDQRMRGVWYELGRRHRDGTFMHPAAAWWYFDATTNAEERQGVTLTKLLNAVLRYVAQPGVTSTRRKVEQRRSHNLKMAKQLRIDANALRVDKSDARWRYVLRPDESGKRRCRLIAAAETYEECAKNDEEDLQIEGCYFWHGPLILDRDRGDPADRWLACAISSTCRTLFSSPMYGITATIMSVALGRTITPRAVRQWCAHSADKTSKNRP